MVFMKKIKKTTQFPNYFPFEMYLPMHLKNMIPFPCKAYLAPNWFKSVSVLVQEKNRIHLKVNDRNKNYGNNWKMDKLYSENLTCLCCSGKPVLSIHLIQLFTSCKRTFCNRSFGKSTYDSLEHLSEGPLKKADEATLFLILR